MKMKDKIKKLKDQAKSIIDEMEKIDTKMEELAGKDERTEEEATNLKDYAKLKEEKGKEFEALEAKIEEAKAHAKRYELLKDLDGIKSDAGDTNDPDPAPAQGKQIGTPAEAKDWAKEMNAKNMLFMKHLRKETPLSDNEKETVGVVNQKGFHRMVVPPMMAAALMGSKNYVKNVMSPETRAKMMYSVNNGSNSSAAQNLFANEFISTLLKLPYDQLTIYDRATSIGTTSGTVDMPKLTQTNANEFGGMSFTWTDEGESKDETEPSFSQEQISTHELEGYTEITHRLLSRSSIGLEALLRELASGGLRYTVETAMISGSGTGRPQGITQAGINTIARQANNHVEYKDLVNLKHQVKAAHRNGATWLMGDDVEQDLELDLDSQNRPLFSASVANGPYTRMAGYPYQVSENSSTLGNDGDLIFGNWRYYILVMEENITIGMSDDYKFRNNARAYKFYIQVGGKCIQPRAFGMLAGVGS
jgi:HK97 family phage major capsid protein